MHKKKFDSLHYHIRVIPVSGSSHSGKIILVVSVEVNDVQDTSPAVINVAIVAPQVAVVGNGTVVR